MEPINMGTALLLSCLFPGLGLWKVEYGKLAIFLGYVPGLIMMGIAVIFTFGLGIFLVPILWVSGLFHTWIHVRHHNRQAAKEAGIAQEFASLKEQVQNLGG